ncbi:unnamed protein product [Caenorhabditis auriculariae]|uniref:Leucine-rich PPR motif-containing protein, mitochondrial n=1 Tax=Caenorhabditis auriculariae TaxID=2777116 RepID=A0A8S1GW59_9PELO|nr:unnamed protein product [Caenorhabditis auriculariae]
MLGRGLRLTGARRGFAAAAVVQNQQGAAAPIPASFSNSDRKPIRKYQNGPQMSVEQLKLQKKYGESFQKSNFENLHDAVEFIEYRGQIHTYVMEKIGRLLGEASKSSLSDRQLAVLLSAYGSACDTCSRSKRDEALTSALKTLQQQEIQLGIASRNAVLAARLANNSKSLNVVNELRDMEKAGLEPNEESFGLFADVYAREGNVKAIADLITHMRESGLTVGEDHIVPMVFALAKLGNDSQTNAVIEKFSSKMNVVRLRCAAAQAAIARESANPGHGAFEAIESLRAIPTTAKVLTLENNKHVLMVLMDLVEAGETNALQLLSAYLMLSEDGEHLSERHFNPAVVARSRCILAEGKSMEALALYATIHPNFKNEYFERDLREKLTKDIATLDPRNFDYFTKILKLAEKNGTLEDTDAFLLESGLESESFEKIFVYVKSSQALRKVIMQKPHLKEAVARKLSHKMISVPSSSAQAVYLSDIVNVLFAPTSEKYERNTNFYRILFKLGSNDVVLPLETIPLINDGYVRREYITALLSQLLYTHKSDLLAIDKISKLCSSPVVDGAHAVRLHDALLKFLLFKKTSEPTASDISDGKRVQIVAKILSLDFTVNAKMDFGAQNLTRFLAKDAITEQMASRLVKALENENRVGYTQAEILEARKVLADQPAKAALINRLKKNQTMTRWKEADFEELLTELKHLKSLENVKLDAVEKLQEVIVKRVVEEKSDDIDAIVTVLEATADWRTEMSDKKSNSDEAATKKRNYSPFLKSLVQNLESLALVKALSNEDPVRADRIWMMKTQPLSPDAYLLYASRLFLSEEVSRADEVCAELRTTAQPIHISNLDKLGRRLKKVNLERLEELSTYLGKKFPLAPKQTRRIAAQVKLEQLSELIKKDDLDAAFKFVLQETRVAGRAFGQLPLMTEAIRRGDKKLLAEIHTLVRSVHDQVVANFDLAYAFISAGHVPEARSLIERNNLDIDEKVFHYFITLALASKNAEVLHGLFTVFNGRASTMQLNSLLESLTRLYYNSGDMEPLNGLIQDIESSSFPLKGSLRKFFDGLKVKSSELEQEFEEIKKSQDLPHSAVLKMSSLAMANSQEKLARSLLETSISDVPKEYRHARFVELNEEQVCSAIRRVLKARGVELACQFYDFLRLQRFCAQRDVFLEILVGDVVLKLVCLRKTDMDHGWKA